MWHVDTYTHTVAADLVPISDEKLTIAAFGDNKDTPSEV